MTFSYTLKNFLTNEISKFLIWLQKRKIHSNYSTKWCWCNNIRVRYTLHNFNPQYSLTSEAKARNLR